MVVLIWTTLISTAREFYILATISLLFIAGTAVFYFVDEKKGKEEAAILGSS